MRTNFFYPIITRHFIIAFIGTMVWLLLIHYLDDFNSGILIVFFSVTLAFLYARERVNKDKEVGA